MNKGLDGTGAGLWMGASNEGKSLQVFYDLSERRNGNLFGLGLRGGGGVNGAQSLADGLRIVTLELRLLLRL